MENTIEPMRHKTTRSNVGFTQGTFGNAGSKRAFYTWYPTTERESAYIYDTVRNIRSRVALDAALPDQPTPLILFSHGTNANGLQSIYICESLAAAGCMVCATDHNDHDVPSYRDPNAWNDNSCAYRRDDLHALLDFAEAEYELSQIAIMGHSLGGYTALSCAGAQRSWHDDRIRGGCIALSPWNEPIHDSVDGVRIPAMLQGGTTDIGITPTLDGIYDHMHPAKYLVVFRRVGHMDFSNNACDQYESTDACLNTEDEPELIAKYAASFAKQYLRNIDDGVLSGAPLAGVARLQSEVRR